MRGRDQTIAEIRAVTTGTFPYTDAELARFGAATRTVRPGSDEYFDALDLLENELDSVRPYQHFGWWDSDTTQAVGLQVAAAKLGVVGPGTGAVEIDACGLVQAPLTPNKRQFDLWDLFQTPNEQVRRWADGFGEHQELLARLADWLTSQSSELLGVLLASVSPQSWALRRVNALPPRLRSALVQRYGLDGQAPKTLEEVGSPLNLSRERIRQLQASAMKKLAIPATMMAARKLLERQRNQVWCTVAGHARALPKTPPVSEIEFRRASPALAFLVDLAFGSITDWLDKNAQHTRKVWYWSDSATVMSKADRRRVAALVAEIPLPAVETDVATRVDVPLLDLELATLESNGISLFEGFVIPGRPSPRRRRAVRMYRLLKEHGQPMSIPALTAEHNTFYPSEACSPRDAQIVMADAKHLFINLGDFGWAAIGPQPSEPDGQWAFDEALFFFDIHEPETPVLEGQVRTVIEQFEKDKVLTWVELVERLSLAPTPVRRNSLAVVLVVRHEFKRVAPGVWALACRSRSETRPLRAKK